MTITAIVAPDGSVVDSIMAEPDEPVLAERWPGMQFVAVPAGKRPNNRWTYVGGEFTPPIEETSVILKSNQVNF